MVFSWPRNIYQRLFFLLMISKCLPFFLFPLNPHNPSQGSENSVGDYDRLDLLDFIMFFFLLLIMQLDAGRIEAGSMCALSLL